MELSCYVKNFLLKSKARQQVFLDLITDKFVKKWHLIPKYRKRLNAELRERLITLSRRGRGRK